MNSAFECYRLLFNMFHTVNDLAYYSHNFYSAMMYDEPDALSRYLKGHDPATVQDSFGNNLLHVCAKYGGRRILKFFIKSGCRVNQRNQHGDTPLLFAVSDKNYQVVKTLLDNGADIRVKNDRGEGPLHLCKQFYHKDIVKTLVKFMRANHGMSLDEIGKMFVEANCTLHMAVFTRETQLVRIINDHRGNVNELDDSGRTALHAAIYDGSQESIQCLLDLGAEIDGMLHWAARQVLRDEDGTAYREMLKFLLDHGAEVNQMGLNLRRPLHMVVKYGNEAAVKLLLEYGADPSLKDDANKSVLHFAAKNSDVKILKLFLNNRELDINERNGDGRTPLHVASKWGKLPCIKLLLDSDVEVNVIDNYKYTPLSALIESSGESNCDKHRQDEMDALKLLLDHGADVNIPNPRDKSILSDAFEKGLDRIIVRHLAKLEQPDRPIDKTHMQFIDAHRSLSEYLKECRRELGSLKMEKVFQRVSFYEVLVADVFTMAGYTRNPELARAFHDSKYKEKYPLYSDALERNFMYGMKKHELLTEASAKLRSCGLFSLPEITERILFFISTNDLYNICSC